MFLYTIAVNSKDLTKLVYTYCMNLMFILNFLLNALLLSFWYQYETAIFSLSVFPIQFSRLYVSLSSLLILKLHWVQPARSDFLKPHACWVSYCFKTPRLLLCHPSSFTSMHESIDGDTINLNVLRKW